MADDSSYLESYIDLRSNLPKSDEARALFAGWFRESFEARLIAMVERTWELPPIVLKRDGDYQALLLEARDLYLHGYFYACVAMCGIVGERLVKDVLREATLVRTGNEASSPPSTAFDQLERVDVSALIRFLRAAGVLPEQVAKAASHLAQLRNSYAHARGADPAEDALSAIRLLHEVVEEVVSVFREFELGSTGLVPKTEPSK